MIERKISWHFLQARKIITITFFSNGYSDSWFSAKDGNNADEWFELNPETLEAVAGGVLVAEYNEFDTYRYWRDQNGVLREIR